VSWRHFVVAASDTVEDADNSHDQKVEPTRAEILLAGASSEFAVEESPSTGNLLILVAKELVHAHIRL
jgi:hypothetical protein